MPSSQGFWKTKWSLEAIAVKPVSRAVSVKDVRSLAVKPVASKSMGEGGRRIAFRVQSTSPSLPRVPLHAWRGTVDGVAFMEMMPRLESLGYVEVGWGERG